MNGARAQSPAQPPAGLRLWPRLRNRLRYGLLTQELLDRLVRVGIIIYPYFVVLEPTGDEPAPAPGERCTLRMLCADDADEVVRLLAGRITAPVFIDLLSKGVCLGAFIDGKLAGYTWARLDSVLIPEGLGQIVFELEPDEAYLFDMYVASAYRGFRVAGFLRQALQRELIRRGRTRFYSLTLIFNRSSRRFKRRLGAREVELRITTCLRIPSLPGCDLRLWRARPWVRSAWVRRVPGAVKAKPHA